MTSDWQLQPLSEIANWYSGGTPSKNNSSFWNGTIPWISAKSMTNFRIGDSEDKITPLGAQGKNKIVDPKSILILVRGSTLHQYVPICITTKSVTFNQDVKALVAKPKIDPSFLFYSLLANSEKIHNMVEFTGIGAGKLDTNRLKSFLIPVPPLNEQQDISRFFSLLDDKIELNRQINVTLEAMARSIFKSWFVDFDPVRAKAEGRDTGLPAEVAALFPSEFVEVDGREVPRGWGVGKIADVVEINEKSISREYPFTQIDYIEISSVTKGKLESSLTIFLNEAPSRAQRLVRNGDTIWSGVRPNRESYLFIQHPKENLVVSTGFVVLTPHKIPPTYLFSWVTTEDFVDYLTANADGSAYPAVRADHFGNAELLIPSKEILAEFERIIAPMRAKIHHNEQQSRTLGQVRDALLPKLMSGEIQV